VTSIGADIINQTRPRERNKPEAVANEF